MTIDVGTLLKRHGALHHANVKFGYEVLVFSVVLLALRALSLGIYERSWAKTGRSTSKAGVVKALNGLTLGALCAAVVVMFFLDPHYEHFITHIRRLGRISYALVPLDIILAARPAYIPLDNYINTIFLHKWTSRLIVILGIIHSIGFCIFYAHAGTLQKIVSFYNIFGVVAFIFSCIIFGFWKPVRNFVYKLFYVLHTLFMISFIVLITWHARPGVGAISVINLILLIVHYTLKYLQAKDITFNEIIENPNSNLKIIKFPKQIIPEDYLPGSHLRIGCSKWSPGFLVFPTHPYTIASTRSRDNLASLVVKSTRFQIEPFETYSMQPYFKSSLSKNFFDTAENVTIICGGSGVSFGLSLYEFFTHKLKANPTDELHVKFIWITRREDDLYILKELGIVGLEVFVTNTESDEINLNNNDDGIELDTLANPFKDPVSSVNAVSVGSRPNLEHLVTPHLNLTIDYSNKWIIACGPASLNNTCQQLASKSKCQFFSEEYSM